MLGASVGTAGSEFPGHPARTLQPVLPGRQRRGRKSLPNRLANQVGSGSARSRRQAPQRAVLIFGQLNLRPNHATMITLLPS